MLLGRQAAQWLAFAAHQDHVALGDGRTRERLAAFAFLDRDQAQARVLLQVDRVARLADIGRRGPHAQAVQSVLDPILFDQRLGMRAEVGGQRLAVAMRQQEALGELHDDHRADENRHARDREFEEADAAVAGILRRAGRDHVQGRAEQRQHGRAVRREAEREQQLRGGFAEPERDDDHHRQQRGHGAVHADGGSGERRQEHEQQKRPCLAASRLLDQLLTRPGRNARSLETRAHHEQARDQNDSRVAESGQHLGTGEDAAEEQCQRHADRDDDRRDLVPDEERERGEDDREYDGGITHVNLSPLSFCCVRHPLCSAAVPVSDCRRPLLSQSQGAAVKHNVRGAASDLPHLGRHRPRKTRGRCGHSTRRTAT